MPIIHATTPEQLVTVRALFQEYAEGMGADLNFQGFTEELASLPGKYAPPGGRLLLAEANGTAAGCVAVRPLEEGRCEMKRLYVRPGFRSAGLGRQLAEAALAEGRAIGYRAMRLDTLRTLRPATRLYHSLGFAEIPPYYANPLEGVIYFERQLC